jgi:hypothetical protein
MAAMIIKAEQNGKTTFKVTYRRLGCNFDDYALVVSESETTAERTIKNRYDCRIIYTCRL